VALEGQRRQVEERADGEGAEAVHAAGARVEESTTSMTASAKA